jgi:beta-lactam-binding protein with PASTA domain
VRLQAGQKIGDRYTLQERIGSGGMADVWVAADATLGRRVALKFLHESFGEDEQFIERFRREATAAAGLQHPNIVGIYDRGEFDGRHFIAMEYVEGASLKDLINRGLSVAESIEIVRQILAGARFAHERGIIHRDLKPQNVLIDGEGRARVTDFGIARAGASEMTQTGSVLGTAQYLSPEQAQGLETTATSDIYSVGILLYECLTGRVPFDADSTVAVALKQVSEQPKPPSQVKPSIPHALDGVVLKALAKDPADRYATAAEFSRALDAAEADPTGGATSLQPAAAAALGAAAGAAVAGAATPPPLTPLPPDDEEEEGWLTRRRAIALGIILLLLIALAVYALTRKTEHTVPNVKGKSEATATAELKDAGFDVFSDSFESCDKPGTVSEQDPLAGTTADEGKTVKITVSKGLKVTVPDVTGLPQDKAVTRLQDRRLLPKTTEQFSRGVKAGNVISTDPPFNTEVQCNAPIDVAVSKGANLSTVPDVTGLDQGDATAQLRDAGFVPKVSTKDSDEPEGTVIGEDPGPGSRLPRGRMITLTVSTGAGSVVVPNVIGQPEQTAVDTLKSRGALNIKIVEQETSEQSDDGRVLDQAPSAGTRIISDDRVTIFVGKFVDSGGSTTTTSTSTTSTSTSTAPPGP